MARRQANTNRDNSNNAFSLLNRLGSNLGTILSLCTLAGVISGISTYATTVIKNIEILDIKKEFSIKELEYKSKISELEFEIKIDKSKIAEYERRRK